jgi:hypothetical protein
MKKLLAVAVATTISATSMATISISGNAKFEYKHTDNGTTTGNTTNTETNLNLRGSAGDTKIVADLQLGNTGNADAGATMVIEDLYFTTKLGPVSAKLGNFSSSTAGLLGEIEEGDRSNGKMTFSYTTNGIKFYAGNGDKKDTGGAGISRNMFMGAVATIEGWKLQVKKNNEDKNSFGVSGQAGPVGIRFEYSAGKDDNDTGYFAHFTGKFDNINLGLATVEVKTDGDITEMILISLLLKTLLVIAILKSMLT